MSSVRRLISVSVLGVRDVPVRCEWTVTCQCVRCDLSGVRGLTGQAQEDCYLLMFQVQGDLSVRC